MNDLWTTYGQSLLLNRTQCDDCWIFRLVILWGIFSVFAPLASMCTPRLHIIVYCSHFIHSHLQLYTKSICIYNILIKRSFELNTYTVINSRLIFSAGYYSAPIFFTSSNFFALPILPLFRHFAWNFFEFSRLVSLFCHSARSPFKQHMLSKAIQNEES